MRRNLIGCLALVLFLSGCLQDKASRTRYLNAHALDILLSDDARLLLFSYAKGYVTLADFKHLVFKKRDRWALEQSADAAVTAMAFSKDGRFALTASQKTIARYNLAQSKVDKYWSLDNISDVALSAKGDFALVAEAENKDDQYGKYHYYRLVYFHLPYGKIKYAFYHDDKIATIDLSDDDRFAVSGSDDGTVRLWDLQEGKLLYTWHHPYKISKVRISPKGRYVMSNDANGQIRIYKTVNGHLYRKLSQKFQQKLRGMTVSAAVFSHNNRYLATALSRGELLLWQLKSGKIIKKIHPAKHSFWKAELPSIATMAFTGRNKLVTITRRGVAQEWQF